MPKHHAQKKNQNLLKVEKKSKYLKRSKKGRKKKMSKNDI